MNNSMEEWEIGAREQIRDRIAAYTWCGDFGDASGFSSVFTVNGLLDIKGRAPIRGRTNIYDAVINNFWVSEEITAKQKAAGPLRHHVSSIRIAFTDDRHAESWSYFVVFGKRGPDHWGRYTDRFELVDGIWLFSSRRVSVDAASEGAAIAAA